MELFIYFDGQYWCGILTEVYINQGKSIKYTFGQEPKDAEIWKFIHELAPLLLENAYTIDTSTKKTYYHNPKKMQRKLAKEKKSRKSSTFAQTMYQKSYEKMKCQKKIGQTRRKKIQAEKKYAIKQKKKREKTKGH